MHEILEIVRKINGGRIIPEQDDEKSEVNLFSDVADLYIDVANSKYYFFANYQADIKDISDNNLGQIEKDTIKNTEAYTTIEDPKPNSSYLILFWKVKKIEDAIYSQIINLEENEFYYKKYVFYYMQEELDSFKQWYEEISNIENATISKLLKIMSETELDYEKPHIRFAIRLLTKIPFWTLEFPRVVLNEFDSIVDKRIDGIRGNTKEEIKKMDLLISEAIMSGKDNADALGEYVYNQIMGE